MCIDDPHQVGSHAFLAEMPSRDVDTDAYCRQPCLVPLGDLTTSLAKHPFVDGHDQVALFGDRNEYHRIHDFTVVLPAQQCFGTNDAIAFEVDLRLVMNEQLGVFDGAAQSRFQRQAPCRQMGQVGGEKAKGILAVILGAIHRRVGIAHQGTGIGSIFREHAQPDAGTDEAFVLVELIAGTQGAQQTLSGQRRFVAIGGFEQDHELVAAQACHRVFCAHAVEQAQRRLLEQFVAGGMTEGVVDHLEVVEIDEHHADTLA
ncbi:MAG: hypothetical protein AW09_000573 [Candidatus Accumulibacter phosphatis]|uniref:Uncharacterized protein n=1 Tax=Candidatus Accumulibacter phosphatis TaxID=327160 RepID=A0A080LZ40_9PROT|nr:MAG: hypothetical protein AW09_000573 [Candidatus Accumulibacter phosphatis]